MNISVSKAWALIKTLRWYHLGFAFFWATTFAGLSYAVAPQTLELGVYKLSNQALVIMTVVAMAVYVKLKGRLVPRPLIAVVPSVLLGVGVLLFYVSFHYGQASFGLALASGLLVGVASGLFYVLWQFFFTSEGATRTALYIPLSAVTSAILCVGVQVLPPLITTISVTLVLPALAAWSLFKALKEVELLEADASTHFEFGQVVRDMWKPVFCVCSIGFVWKLVTYLFEGTNASTLGVVLVGFSAAALVIAAVELFSERGFEVLRSYQVLFPLLTGAFLLPAVLGMQFAPVLSGTLMFGFEVVNLLLIVTCAVYANERGVPSTYVYALCMGPTFAAMLTGDALGMSLNDAIAYDLSIVVGILFVCVYVLSCTMLLASWTRRRRQEAGEGYVDETAVPTEGLTSAKVAANAARRVAASSDVHSASSGAVSSLDLEGVASKPDMDVAALEEALVASISAKFETMDVPEPLSQREREVAVLIVRGYSVAAVSRKLFISENTVRGHTKNIYRKLDVHSKQQLIDLVGV